MLRRAGGGPGCFSRSSVFNMSEEMHVAAVRMGKAVAKHLGLIDPITNACTVKVEFWDRPSIIKHNGRNAHGLYSKEIDLAVVCSDLGPDDAARVLAHELRHAWQARNWPASLLNNTTAKEADATAYAARAFHQFKRLP